MCEVWDTHEALWRAVRGVTGDAACIDALEAARSREQRTLGDARQPVLDDLTRRLVARENVPAGELACDPALSLQDFAERCIFLRDPDATPLARTLRRERARLALHLTLGAQVPHDVEGLCRLWEEGVRGDARVYEDGPGRLRTPQDHTPFAHGPLLFDDGPVRPGLETAPARFVPQETKVLLAYVNDEDVPCEIRAFVTHWLVFRIHPFIDGNGRAARMLTTSLLARRYAVATCVAYVSTVQDRFMELSKIEEEASLAGDGLEAVVRIHADCLATAQELVRAHVQPA